MFHANFPGSKALKKTTTCLADHGALPIPHLSPQKKRTYTYIYNQTINFKPKEKHLWKIPYHHWVVVSNIWFSPLLGEDEPILTHIFSKGVETSTHQPDHFLGGVFWWIPCFAWPSWGLIFVATIPCSPSMLMSGKSPRRATAEGA